MTHLFLDAARQNRPFLQALQGLPQWYVLTGPDEGTQLGVVGLRVVPSLLSGLQDSRQMPTLVGAGHCFLHNQ